MELTKWNPGREIAGVNRLLHHFFEDPFSTGLANFEDFAANAWAPKVNIYNSKDHYIIKAELPGMKKEDIKVDVNNGVLSLKGERREETESEKKSCYRKEMFYGKFERSFSLPETVDTANIKAEYKDGLLTLEIPKPEEQKPKQILIN